MKYTLTFGSVRFQWESLSLQLEDIRLEAELSPQEMASYLEAIRQLFELTNEDPEPLLVHN